MRTSTASQRSLPSRLAACLVALLLGGLLLACADLNFEPVDAQLFDPPDIYRQWWTQVERCTDVEAGFERVFWYRATEIIDRENGTLHSGAWKPPHTIFIRTGSLGNRQVVKHEMVHDLLQTRNHDLDVFDRCAGL